MDKNKECDECKEFERSHLGKAIKELRRGLRDVEKSLFFEALEDIEEGIKDIEEGLEVICEGLHDILDDECDENYENDENCENDENDERHEHHKCHE